MDGKIIQAGKFDNKSTDMEREQFLKSLLTSTVDAEIRQESLEVSDEELNELLARNEHELHVFHKMDKDRVTNDNIEWASYGRPGEMPGRLYTLNELPQVYKSEFNPLDLARKDDPNATRKKQLINYDDTMTEDEYVEGMIDNSNGTTNKRQASQSRSIYKKPKTLLPYGIDLIDAIVSDLDTSEGYDRQRAYLFLKLPSKVDYPSYYVQIKSPISLNEIQNKLENGKYGDLAEMLIDFKMMFDNARSFNVEGSLVYEDANYLEALANEKRIEFEGLLKAEKEDNKSSSSSFRQEEED
eukprot:NODE_36_length_31474_cov_0.342438.p11 type:complete len:298 gc:universal NODE_36_length_31474_cov_0.342438:6742-5849(-)